MDAFEGDRCVHGKSCFLSIAHRLISDVEDSQATQILLDLVPGQASSLLSPARPVETIQSPVPLSLDVAPESFSSSRHSNSLPTYHYHGLATTQTQTQSVAEEEEEEVQEGSQKENIGQSAQGSRQTPLVSRSMRTDPSPSKAAPVRSNTGGPRSHSLAHSKARFVMDHHQNLFILILLLI